MAKDLTENSSLVEKIRARPGMYIGYTSSRGLREMIHQFVRDALALPGSNIPRVAVALGPSGVIEIILDGNLGQFALSDVAEIIMTPRPAVQYFAFAQAAALSERFTLQVAEGDQYWEQEFRRGIASPPRRVGGNKKPDFVRITIQPDYALFPDRSQAEYFPLCGRMQEFGIFHPLTRFQLADEGLGTRREFYYPNGLRSYVEEIEYQMFATFPTMRLYHLRQEEGPNIAEAVIYDRTAGPCFIHSFVNKERTPWGGTHVDGFERGYIEMVKSLAKQDRTPRKYWSDKDYFEGLTVVLSLQLETVDWASSYFRAKLGGEYPERLTYDMTKSQLTDLFRNHAT